MNFQTSRTGIPERDTFRTGPSKSPEIEPPDGEIDLGDLLAQLLARKWTILFLVLLGILGGALYALLQPNLYSANSVVQVEQKKSAAGLPEDIISEIMTGETSDSSLETEFHIIKSRLTLYPVVEELRLHYHIQPKLVPFVGDLLKRHPIFFLEDLLPVEYVLAGETISVDQLLIGDEYIHTREENQFFPGETANIFVLKVLSATRFQLTAPNGITIEGEVGEPTRIDGVIELLVDEIRAPAGREFRLFREDVRVAAERLSKDLTVSERRDSEVIDFKLVSHEPSEARTNVNAIVDSYQQRNLSRRSAEIDNTIAFIQQQLPQVRASLEEDLEELARYQEDNQSADLSLVTQDLLERSISLETSLRDLEFREQLYSETLASDHPDLVALRSGKKQIQARLDEVRASLSAVPQAERDLAALTEEAARSRELLVQLESRMEELRIARASTLGNIRVLETAESVRLVGPNRILPAALGGLLAFCLGVAFVLGSNAARRGIEDARNLEVLGLSLFASVGKVDGLAKAKTEDPRYSLAKAEPDNLVIESLRGLRTGLTFSLGATDSKTVMITSCAPNDGKSFISLNLALVSAGTSNRVLLMDVDLRRGELRKRFNLPRDMPGLSEFLAGSASFQEIIHKDESGLEFIPAGRYPPNPSELLAGPRFSGLLEKLDEHYDLIILDAPPILAVTDPGIVGRSAGLSLLVVKHLVTTPTEIQAAQNALETSGVHLSGAVINQFNPKKGRYGGYGARYGYYSTNTLYQYK